MIQLVKSSDKKALKIFFKKIILPKTNSHKGQNGKILVIGGSSLFHAASLWAAEICSYFADIVHYSSTEENEKIFLNLKTKFRNGIVIPQKDLLDYVKEDDVVLLGPGMLREDRSKIKSLEFGRNSYSDLLKVKKEGFYTYLLTKYLIKNFSKKKFVFDAGALQMMEKGWLLRLKTKAIITPHQKEFKQLFNEDILNLDFEDKIKKVELCAKKYNVIILLKAIKDIVSDGKSTYIVEGGNAGLTKGGSGDILAGLTASFYVKNNPLESALLASLLIKKTAETLFLIKGYWYNVSDIIATIPKILKKIIFDL